MTMGGDIYYCKLPSEDYKVPANMQNIIFCIMCNYVKLYTVQRSDWEIPGVNCQFSTT